MALAMATAPKLVYSHITKAPDVRGGRACVDGRRIAVVDIVFLWKEGQSPEQILEAYPALTLAQVHAALSYYYENPAEIEAELVEDDGWEEEDERLKAEYLAR